MCFYFVDCRKLRNFAALFNSEGHLKVTKMSPIPSINTKV